MKLPSWITTVGVCLLWIQAAQAQGADHKIWSLERYLARVQDVSPAVEQASANARASEAASDAAWLELLPRVEFGASYTRLSDVDNPPLLALDEQTLAAVSDPVVRGVLMGASQTSFPVIRDQWLTRATIAYPLSAAILTALPGADASQTLARAAHLQERFAKSRIRLTATEVYIELKMARELLQVSEVSLQHVRKATERTQRWVEQGALPRVELRRARTALYLEQSKLDSANANVASAETAFRSLAELPAEDALALDVDDSLTQNKSPEQQQIRPDLAALRELERAERERARSATGQAWPQLEVFAQATYANPNGRVVPQQEQWNSSWAAGVRVKWSPDEALRAEARARTARALADIRRRARETSEQERQVAIAQARALLAASQTSEARLQEAVDEQQQVLTTREAQHAQGTALVDDVLEAHRELREVQLQLVRVRTSILRSQAHLDHHFGR